MPTDIFGGPCITIPQTVVSFAGPHTVAALANDRFGGPHDTIEPVVKGTLVITGSHRLLQALTYHRQLENLSYRILEGATISGTAGTDSFGGPCITVFLQ